MSQSSVHYRMINSSQAQAVIQKVDEAMKSFFCLLKTHVKQKVRLPRYLKRGELFPLIDRAVYKPHAQSYTLPRSNFMKSVSKFFESTSRALDKRGIDLMHYPSLHVKLPTPSCITNKKIKEITIIPKYDGQYMDVTYVYENNEKMQEMKDRTELID